MRVHLTVMAAAIVLMVVVAVTSAGGQPQKRSVLRYSPNSGARSVVRPVTFNDERYAQEPPIHQPPQVNAYTPAATRRVINLQQGSQEVAPQASQQLFMPPQTRSVNYGQTASDAPGGCDCQGARSPCCGDSPCCGSNCCGSSCCGSSCCGPACCAPSCCGSTCCGSILPKLFGGHCGCGHGGCCDDCCDGCDDCCGHRGCGHHHGAGCGCGSCCHDCCACPCAHGVDLFGWWNTLFGPCCRSRGGCHAACECGCAADYGCSGCGGCDGCGAAVMPGPVNKKPTPNNGSPSDIPPPPKVP
jgi:hypothetical protein